MHYRDLSPVFLDADDGSGSGSGEDGNEGAGGDGFKAITRQEDLDRIIKDRLARERSRFADYDELKDKAGRFDDLEAQSKTELEREREARTKAEETNATLVGELRKVRGESATVAAAAGMSILDPEAAYALIREKINYDEAGTPTNVEELLKELVEKKPYLVGNTRSHGSGGGGARQDQGTGNNAGAAWLRDGFR